MTDKPQLETGKLPTQPDPIQRWIPGRKLGGFTPGQRFERLKHALDQIVAAIELSHLEGGLSISDTEILEQSTTSREINREEIGDSQSSLATPGEDLEITDKLAADGRRVLHQYRGPTVGLTEPAVSACRCVPGEGIRAAPIGEMQRW